MHSLAAAAMPTHSRPLCPYEDPSRRPSVALHETIARASLPDRGACRHLESAAGYAMDCSRVVGGPGLTDQSRSRRDCSQSRGSRRCPAICRNGAGQGGCDGERAFMNRDKFRHEPAMQGVDLSSLRVSCRVQISPFAMARRLRQQIKRLARCPTRDGSAVCNVSDPTTLG
jgi:hypothetical protein